MDPFHARTTVEREGQTLTYYRLAALEEQGLGKIPRLPISIRILLEAVLRQFDDYQIRRQDVLALAGYQPQSGDRKEVPFKPARVVLQDLTGVPAVVDLASMRSKMRHLGGDSKRINPLIPVDLVVDHSVQVDRAGQATAFEYNMQREFERNQERYRLLKWAQASFDNFRVIPPDTGIIHQVNLEYLASVVTVRERHGAREVFPDTLVGTDSHTTMINGLGILGWGVGGIEAEANMLGQPLYLLLPEVLGVKVTGRLPAGATATDLALTITQLLRKYGVVGRFVEFFGPGVRDMTLADRATVANMAPEYGATMGFFPTDAETLNYLRATGRSEAHIQLVEWYLREQGLFVDDNTPAADYLDVLELDLGSIEPSLAGPKRPQDRIPLAHLQSAFRQALTAPVPERGFGVKPARLGGQSPVATSGDVLRHGSVVIAAITSCTNTSNPSVMVGAGLLAKHAVERGLKVPGYVKTSLAPGSRVVTAYLQEAGLTPYLEQLGFHLVGYGCTTCIGNSGPLDEAVARVIQAEDLTVAAVLSGNRNFEGRIHALVKANYLASPPLVVAYALAGTVDIDLPNAPLGYDAEHRPVYLRDLWPSPQEVEATLTAAIQPELYHRQYQAVFGANSLWNALDAPQGDIYAWDPDSTYIQDPPFFKDWSERPQPVGPIVGARILALFGDSITTDHISPAGSIGANTPAAKYLAAHGVNPADFNTYGSRRGNHEVMMRGTFANIRIRNQIVPQIEGGFTKHFPDGDALPIFDAAMTYEREHVPLVVFAGKEYGTGSSRDWAAKGTMLLGVKAVIAESFERIHRSNLVGMGVLPLQFHQGDGWQSLGLTGEETVDIHLPSPLTPLGQVDVEANGPDGRRIRFQATLRLDTPIDVDYYRLGGILPTVLGNLMRTGEGQ